MKNRKFFAFISGLMLGLPGWVAADDIEVYTGASLSAGARPNVVFIFDTSREMTYGPNRVQIHETYDPDFVYPGNCERNKVYMTPGSRKNEFFTDSFRWDDAPDEATGLRDDGCTYDSTLTDYSNGGDGYPFYRVQIRDQETTFSNFIGTGIHASVDDVQCAAAISPLKTAGYYQGNFTWRRHEFWNGGWQYRAGLNWGRLGNTPDFWMQHFYCSGDGALPGPSESFFLFTGNYLNWFFNYRKTRLQIAKEGIDKMIDALPGGVNVGLMTLTENTLGARVVFPAVDLGANKAALKTALNNINAALNADGTIVGKRGIAGSMFEAYNYFAGKQAIPSDWNTIHSVSTSLMPDGKTFDSPIDLACQKNHVILVTDGENDETNSSPIADRINALPDFTSTVGSCSSSLGGDCATRIASYMQKRDVNDSMLDDQNVTTHAIGIGIEGTDTFFNNLATAGGGRYVLSNDPEDLKTQIQNLFETDVIINGTFVAPAVSVNAFNRSQHRDELYFAVFEVGEVARWNGNLKKYQLKRQPDDSLVVVDADQSLALDPTTGEFYDAARSWWSPTPDGNDPVKGGANARLQSWVDNNTSRSLWTNVAPGSYIITADNRLSSANNHITAALTGAADETQNDDWLDAFTSGRFRSMYGAPLHSRPFVVNYGGSDANPDAVMYFTTNDGMLHALHPGNSTTTDSLGGYEKFAFMPKEMLPRIGTLTSSGVAPMAYGLDASVVPWVKDADLDGNIESGDHVYLYFGSGRGGRFYYGLDVTSYSSPKLLWSNPIKGGTGGDFNEMGYTTADPVRGRIKIGSTAYDVLIISGGYDLNEDNMPTSAADTMGRSIYIVDATNGNLLWHGGPSGSGADEIFSAMTYAIPASPRVLDMNGDGYSDRMYVGDLGGQLWRFDIDNTASSASSLVDGGVIADLGLTATEQTDGKHRRKFFNTPDVALINDKVSGAYLAINIGSGNRAHPVQDKYTNDMFFSIRDRHVYDEPADYSSSNGYGIALSDLVDVSGTTSPVISSSSKGWYLKMRANEKVLAESRTFENQVMFTTYQPDSSITTDACKPNLGIGRVYAMDVRSTKPIKDVDEDNVEETDDRDQELMRTGIPPEVVILFPKASDGRPVALVGPELVNVKLGNTRYRTYWTDKEKEN